MCCTRLDIQEDLSTGSGIDERTPEMQDRGSWRQARSVERYEKRARLGAQLLKDLVELQAHALRCEQVEEDNVLRQRTVAYPFLVHRVG